MLEVVNRIKGFQIFLFRETLIPPKRHCFGTTVLYRIHLILTEPLPPFKRGGLGVPESAGHAPYVGFSVGVEEVCDPPVHCEAEEFKYISGVIVWIHREVLIPKYLVSVWILSQKFPE